MNSSIMTYRKKLSEVLAPSRFEHSLSVSYTCMSLAMCYGCDLEQAELAGLLHDCAKQYSDEVILEKCRKKNIPVTEDELLAPPVLHAKYGAWMARNRYGIEDEDIISAIACHTTGKPDMTLLEQILYVADYIEPRRDKAGNLPQMRRMAYQNLEDAVRMILASTLTYLESRGSYVDIMTKNAFEYYNRKAESK